MTRTLGTALIRHLTQHEHRLVIGHATDETRVHSVVHRTLLRAVLHPPRSIWIVKDLIAVRALQHRRNAQRVSGIGGFVDSFNKRMNSLNSWNEAGSVLKERRWSNRSKIRNKQTKNTLPLLNVGNKRRRHEALD